MDDEVFALLFVVIGVCLFIDDALKGYGYDRAVNDIIIILIVLIALSALILLSIYIYKKQAIAKRESEDCKNMDVAILPEPVEQPLTERELPIIEDNCKTIETPQKQVIPKRKDITITVDPYKGFFRFKELKLEEVKYLIAKGYRVSEHKSLSSNKKEKFLLKQRFNESLNHCFVVFDIANFLEKNKIPVSLFATKKPDLVFELNSRKFAVEVETGKNRFKTERLKEKVELLKSYDSWFFVVTNRNFSKYYRCFGKVVELRRLKNFLSKLLKNGHLKTADKSKNHRREVTIIQSKKSLPIIGSSEKN